MGEGESGGVGEGLLDYCLTLAEEAFREMNGPDQGVWLMRLEAEHESFRAVLSCSIEAHDGETALRLCAALQPYWRIRDHIEEGLNWTRLALDASDPESRSAMRANVLNGAGVLARMLGDFGRALEYHQHSLEIRRELGDKSSIAACFNGMGNVASDRRDFATSREYYEKSLAIKRELGDRKAQAGALNNLGFLAYRQEDFQSAQLYYEQSLEIRRESGNLEHIAQSLEGFAEVASRRLEWERAVQLWAAADYLREKSNSPVPAHERYALDQDLRAAREALGSQSYSSAWEQGRTMSLDELVEYALNGASA